MLSMLAKYSLALFQIADNTETCETFKLALVYSTDNGPV